MVWLFHTSCVPFWRERNVLRKCVDGPWLGMWPNSLIQVVYDGCGGLYTYYDTSTYFFMECYWLYFWSHIKVVFLPIYVDLLNDWNNDLNVYNYVRLLPDIMMHLPYRIWNNWKISIRYILTIQYRYWRGEHGNLMRILKSTVCFLFQHMSGIDYVLVISKNHCPIISPPSQDRREVSFIYFISFRSRTSVTFLLVSVRTSVHVWGSRVQGGYGTTRTGRNRRGISCGMSTLRCDVSVYLGYTFLSLLAVPFSSW